MPDPTTTGSNFDFADKVARTLFEQVTSVFPGEKPSPQVQQPLPILVALSGGPDSTALLTALHVVSDRYPLILHAFHLNHNQRGHESEADEQFCINLCKTLVVPLSTERLSGVEESRFASESDLRRQRYDFFAKIAVELRIPFVALGHTLDDQTETVLFRLFRGTSPVGLTGIPATRVLDNGVAVVRPMLDLRHADCLRFLSTKNIEACEDSSNADTRFTRNFLRRDVVPLIEQRFTGFSERVEQLRRIMIDENDLLDDLATEALAKIEEGSAKSDCCSWSAKVVASLHPAVLRRAITVALRQRQVEVTFERIEIIAAMCQHPHWHADRPSQPAFSLNECWDVRAESSSLVWHAKGRLEPAAPFELPVSVPGTTLVPNLGLALVVEACEPVLFETFPRASDLNALVDLSKCSTPLVVRPRRPGDIITPFGMPAAVKLKKFLHTHKCNSGSLDDVLLANADEVLWVPGVGLSEKLRVVDRATHRLSLIAVS